MSHKYSCLSTPWHPHAVRPERGARHVRNREMIFYSHRRRACRTQRRQTNTIPFRYDIFQCFIYHPPAVIMGTLNMSCFHFATMALCNQQSETHSKFLSNLVRAHASRELAGVETLNMKTCDTICIPTYIRDNTENTYDNNFMWEYTELVVGTLVPRTAAMLDAEHILFGVRLARLACFLLRTSNMSKRIFGGIFFCAFVWLEME